MPTGEPLDQDPTVDVVVHPVQPQGVHAALEGIDGIRLLTPEDGDGIETALRAGAPVLVTVAWRQSFMQPTLRWVACVSAGFEQFPLERLVSDGVALTTAQGADAIPMEEHALELLLASTRRIGQSARISAERT